MDKATINAKTQRRIHSRVKRIIGQLEGVARMIEADASSEAILVQISAASAALHKAGQAILEEHIRRQIGSGTPKRKRLLADFSTIISRFVSIR